MKLKFFKTYYHNWCVGGNNKDGALFQIIYDTDYIDYNTKTALRNLGCAIIDYKEGNDHKDCLFIPESEYSQIKKICELIKDMQIERKIIQKDNTKKRLLEEQSKLDKIKKFVDVDKVIEL